MHGYLWDFTKETQALSDEQIYLFWGCCAVGYCGLFLCESLGPLWWWPSWLCCSVSYSTNVSHCRAIFMLRLLGINELWAHPHSIILQTSIPCRVVVKYRSRTTSSAKHHSCLQMSLGSNIWSVCVYCIAPPTPSSNMLICDDVAFRRHCACGRPPRAASVNVSETGEKIYWPICDTLDCITVCNQKLSKHEHL